MLRSIRIKGKDLIDNELTLKAEGHSTGRNREGRGNMYRERGQTG